MTAPDTCEKGERPNMSDATLTFDLTVRHSFTPMRNVMAEHKVTISDMETMSKEDLRVILHAAIDETARLAHAAVDVEEEETHNDRP